MFRISFVFLMIAGWIYAAGAGECAYTFNTPEKKIVLPNGYFNNYVLEGRSSNPRYMGIELNVKQLDDGYIYCVALEKGGKTQCLENLNELADNKHVKFIGIDGKMHTYFLFKGNNLNLDILMPITKKYLDKENVRMTLLQYSTEGLKRVCEPKRTDLKVDLKRFEVSYKIVQDITESNGGKPKIEATTTIINPDSVGIVVSDIVTGKRKAFSIGQFDLPLQISKGGMAGFCLTMETEPDDETLKKGSDYFCRSVTLGQGIEQKGMAAVRATTRDKYIQLVKCTNKKGCKDPLETLGSKKAITLNKAGYSLRSLEGKKGNYILAGPFTAAKAKEVLPKIKAIVPKASPF
jgi:hypothetical protein